MKLILRYWKGANRINKIDIPIKYGLDGDVGDQKGKLWPRDGQKAKHLTLANVFLYPQWEAKRSS